jgi:ABC-type branched-subunit amino acid transport system ATPase component
LLKLSGLAAGYGPIAVLHGIDPTVAAGEIVAVLGANGAGKTTLLRAISGVVPVRRGAIRFGGRSILNELRHWLASRVLDIPAGLSRLRALLGIALTGLEQ